MVEISRDNQKSWGLLTGMLAGYMSSRRNAAQALTGGQRAGLTALGGVGIASDSIWGMLSRFAPTRTLADQMMSPAALLA